MSQAVPIIYTPSTQPPIVSAVERFGAMLIALAALAVLIVATVLPPSPKGVGTHRGMGFPECAWLTTAHLPCPTCGMTTSFSHFVRGNWLASLYVQPMGFLLALLTGALFWASLYIALTGRAIHRMLRHVPMVWLIGAFMAFAIAAWGWKIFIHLKGIDGWG